MTIYKIDNENGESEVSSRFFEQDTTLFPENHPQFNRSSASIEVIRDIKNDINDRIEQSFNREVDLTKNCFRRVFLGEDNHDYDYALDYFVANRINFHVATHPEVTFSCPDKVNMYNTYGCSRAICPPDVYMSPDGWGMDDLIKTVYFLNKGSVSEKESVKDYSEVKYHIAVIPGKPPGAHIDQNKSFRDVCKDLGVSVKKRIRTVPVEEHFPFWVGQEGCLSGLIPEYATLPTGEKVESKNLVEAIYFDEKFLTKSCSEILSIGSPHDMSISMRHLPLIGSRILKEIGVSHFEKLLEAYPDGTKHPLKCFEESRQKISRISNPLIGDYRDSTTWPSEGEESVLLEFDYIPNHMLSALLHYTDLYLLLLDKFGPEKVFAVDMVYNE